MPPTRAAKQRRRLYIVGGALATAGLAVALVLTGLKASVAYFYTPSDLVAASPPPTGLIRLGGLVAPESVQFANEAKNEHGAGKAEATVAFVVQDEFAQTRVRFSGILPDLFREGQGVVVQGRLSNDGALDAVEVLAKHDETYMPKEVADALKEQGRWKDGEENDP